MIDEAAIQMIRDALYIVLLIATPLLLVGMILGLLISLVQSVTSIQDHLVVGRGGVPAPLDSDDLG